jgi:short-subunit dehydrogenase
VATVHPGYVESEIGRVDNEGRFDASRADTRPARLLWTAERAARVMLPAIARREREFVFTAHGKLGAFVGQHFPGIVQLVGKRFTRKRERVSA